MGPQFFPILIEPVGIESRSAGGNEDLTRGRIEGDDSAPF